MSDGNRHADDPGCHACGGQAQHRPNCRLQARFKELVKRAERSGATFLVGNPTPDLDTLLAELDSWHQGWRQAVRERDEARRECDEARARAIRWNNEHVAAEDRWVEERDALRALVAQQREAALALCDEADTCENCYQESKKARAVLTAEVPRE